MDQGVIECLKVNYRKLLLRKRLQGIEDGVDVKVNLLEAFHLIRRAWDSVEPSTIAKCFRKVGFIRNETPAFDGIGFEGFLK
jgi:hypothetical protein